MVTTISRIRAALRMTETLSWSKIARQIHCSRTSLKRWKSRFLESGYSLSDLPNLSDGELEEAIYLPCVADKFFPWKTGKELWQEFSLTHQSIGQFYKTVYLPKVPTEQKALSVSSFYRYLARLRSKYQTATAQATDAKTVDFFGITDEVQSIEPLSLSVDQVRITLAGGASIEFFPGGESEAFVRHLLKENGVRL